MNYRIICLKMWMIAKLAKPQMAGMIDRKIIMKRLAQLLK